MTDTAADISDLTFEQALQELEKIVLGAGGPTGVEPAEFN